MVFGEVTLHLWSSVSSLVIYLLYLSLHTPSTFKINSQIFKFSCIIISISSTDTLKAFWNGKTNGNVVFCSWKRFSSHKISVSFSMNLNPSVCARTHTNTLWFVQGCHHHLCVGWYKKLLLWSSSWKFTNENQKNKVAYYMCRYKLGEGELDSHESDWSHIHYTKSPSVLRADTWKWWKSNKIGVESCLWEGLLPPLIFPHFQQRPHKESLCLQPKLANTFWTLWIREHLICLWCREKELLILALTCHSF